MRRASVTVKLDPFEIGISIDEEVQGYACEIAGLDMVVHRAQRYEGGPHWRLWTVTEPRTGRAIASSYGRALAIEVAEEKVAFKGGREAIEELVQKFLAAQPQSEGTK